MSPPRRPWGTSEPTGFFRPALTRTLMVSMVFAWPAVVARSAEVWRCEAVAPRTGVTYQSRPCNAHGRALPALPARPDAEHAEAVAVARRERLLAREMGEHRLKLERHQNKQRRGAASLTGPVPQVSVGGPAQAQGDPKRPSRQTFQARAPRQAVQASGTGCRASACSP